VIRTRFVGFGERRFFPSGMIASAMVTHRSTKAGGRLPVHNKSLLSGLC